MFLYLGVFFLVFLCSVYPLVKSLYWGVRKIGYYGTIFCSIICWDLLNVVFLALGSKKFSLIFNRFGRVNFSRSVWLSCSITIIFVSILIFYPSMSKWVGAGIFFFLVTSSLWLLCLIFNLVSDFSTYSKRHFKHSNKCICTCSCNLVNKRSEKFLKRHYAKKLSIRLVCNKGCLNFNNMVYHNHVLISASVFSLFIVFESLVSHLLMFHFDDALL